jgi:hypothetical protein
MAAKIVYFGADTCHRLAVLRRAGYVVENSKALEPLGAMLQTDEISAVLTTDRDIDVSDDLLTLVRSRSFLPLILFRDSNRNCDERRFDLVIPALTSPPRWLADLASLVALVQAFPKPPRSTEQTSSGTPGFQCRSAEPLHL